MSFAPPVSRDGFYYNGDLYVETGNLNRHKRASIPEITAILRPELKKAKAGTTPEPPKDQVAHWYEAQLIHYGLPSSKDKARAKMRLLDALNSAKLNVPTNVIKIEADLKKEYAAADRKAKGQYKANLAASTESETPASAKKRKQAGTTNSVNVNINFGNFGPPHFPTMSQDTPGGYPETGPNKKSKLSTNSAQPNMAQQAHVHGHPPPFSWSAEAPHGNDHPGSETAPPKTYRTQQTARKLNGPSVASSTAIDRQVAKRSKASAFSPSPATGFTPDDADIAAQVALAQRITKGKKAPSAKQTKAATIDDTAKAAPKMKKEKPVKKEQSMDEHVPAKKTSAQEITPAVKKEPARKKATTIKDEPTTKKEPRMKKEPAVKKEPRMKKEPAVKKESRVKSGTGSSTQPKLGLINGYYDISCPHVEYMWPNYSENLSLILCLESPHVWGAYDFGMFSGILRIGSRPFEVSNDPLPCRYRGRENGEGEMDFGDHCSGAIAFLGDGNIEGWLNFDGECHFQGVRRPYLGTAVRNAASMKQEWDGYDEEEYEAARVGRWR
ncbi:MAG: hypothetical protein LQ350_007572 [Teloschistes chrysophthalmus]|nr:MAG: hypothetical protein LQ350_007572 [Niorma chrysophthalma]